MYFTHNPRYANSYFRKKFDKKLKHGVNDQLILSWVLIGSPTPLQELRMGMEPPSDKDSFYVIVDSKGLPIPSESSMNLSCGDEVVVFDPARVLPRFIVTYSVKG